MKKLIFTAAAAFLAMALLPLIASGGQPATDTAVTNGIVSESVRDDGSSESVTDASESVRDDGSSESVTDASAPRGFPEGACFRILNSASGEIVSVSDREFCCGALAYEMQPGAGTEALKAQSVACYTHFCRLREQQKRNPDSSLNGADFVADLSADEYWLSDATMKQKWGSLYESSRQKIEQAVDACAGLVLTDGDGALIDAAYHAMSGGVTESAADIFGQEDAHLQPTASPWDKAAPDYCTTKAIPEAEFLRLLTADNERFSSETAAGQTDFPAERTPSGVVKTITIGGQSFSGAQLRSIFSLRSADFELKHDNKQFIFTVYGYGHGVGMSQTGAQGMAEQGADFQEILCHYYTDVRVQAYTPTT